MPFTGKATYAAGTNLPELAEDVSDLIGIVPDGFAGISQDAAPTFGMMTGAAIPEPATMGLLVLGGTALLRRRKK